MNRLLSEKFTAYRVVSQKFSIDEEDTPLVEHDTSPAEESVIALVHCLEDFQVHRGCKADKKRTSDFELVTFRPVSKRTKIECPGLPAVPLEEESTKIPTEDKEESSKLDKINLASKLDKKRTVERAFGMAGFDLPLKREKIHLPDDPFAQDNEEERLSPQDDKNLSSEEAPGTQKAPSNSDQEGHLSPDHSPMEQDENYEPVPTTPICECKKKAIRRILARGGFQLDCLLEAPEEDQGALARSCFVHEVSKTVDTPNAMRQIRAMV
ncbi:uncharacterized protein MELLADRAFT_111367 [Melampsora larici-populina 98AG31]|uniref:Uncharacterized protein n=1 Tax=Melampsora larici-populina (strain 98AG31 / pathotype 3-4-7) TaxID=747676 RepID=F4S2Z3_MELLP|nr:uncharacterized protein MELLADRAFT_111367 [Melampsora larici-populina 98AG31]EGG00887.1 hypothetical protein MELLADRAFT_111367 [Melampsora larici-populina 98AG31]